jgi:hypothetical protein
VSSSSKTLSPQPTSVGRPLLREIIGIAARAQGYGAPGAQRSMFDVGMFGVGRLLLEKSKIMITSMSMSTSRTGGFYALNSGVCPLSSDL